MMNINLRPGSKVSHFVSGSCQVWILITLLVSGIMRWADCHSTLDYRYPCLCTTIKPFFSSQSGPQARAFAMLICSRAVKFRDLGGKHWTLPLEIWGIGKILGILELTWMMDWEWDWHGTGCNAVGMGRNSDGQWGKYSRISSGVVVT